jgi:3-oxoacyl-[acyl-carrier-protein] synthase-3
LIVSVIACELGDQSLDVKAHLEKTAPSSLPRLQKTGFETVFQESGTSPGVSMAKRAQEHIPRFEAKPIDAMILVSSFYQTAPSWGHQLASELGLRDDINLIAVQDACTGFLTALSIAEGLIDSGQSKEILVVTFDSYSKYMHGQTGLEILFSDALTLTTVSKNIPESHRPINPLSLVSVSKKYFNKPDSTESLGIVKEELGMNGAGVFQFVIESVPRMIRESLSDLEADVDAVEWYLHQGSRFVVDQLSVTLGVPGDSLFRSKAYGNTVSGSIPFQLYSHPPEKRLVCLVGFGMGLSAKVGVYRLDQKCS